MPNPTKRKKFHMTRYEQSIIRGIFILPMSFCMLFTVMIGIFHNEVIEVITKGSTNLTANYLSQTLTYIVITLWGFFFLSYVLARITSNNMLGAFERILRDLDEMNDTGVKKHLHCRKNDILAGELIRRINTFIDKFTT